MSATAVERDAVRQGRPGPRGQNRARVLPVLIVLAVVVVVVLDYAIAVIRPATRSQIWLAAMIQDGYPTWLLGPMLLAVVAMILLAAAEWRWRAWVVEPLLVIALLGYSLSTRMSPMTGDQPAWLHFASSPLTPATEPLSAAVYKLVAALSGNSTVALQHVAPVGGVFALVSLLHLVRVISRRLGVDVNLLRGFVFATPFPFWWVTGYIENTFLALPAFFLALSFMLRWQESGQRTGDLLLAGATWGLTVCLHGEFLVLLPFAAIWVLTESHRRLTQTLGRLLLAAGASGVVVGAAVGLLVACGLRIVVGAATGGYDGQMLTPMQTRPGDSLSRFSMLSHAHLIQLDNIVVHAAPFVVLALPVLLARVVRGRQGGLRRLHEVIDDPTISLMAHLSVGYLLFAALWGFDFGMVGDIDLMLTMDMPLALLLLVVAHRLLEGRPRVLVALVVGSAWANIAFYSLKVGTLWWS